MLSSVSTLFLLASPYLRITSLGWFIGIWWIPIFGSLFFLLTIVRKQAREDCCNFHLLKKEHQHHEDGLEDSINCLGIDHGYLPYFRLGEYQLFRDDAFIPALYESIESANRRIWMTTYIFSGKVSEELLVRLSKAHERGVQIRLLVDRIGSGLLFPSKSTNETLSALPFNISIFRESFFKSILFVEKRLHSKIVVIDDNLAFIGAHNLRDEVLSQNEGFAKNTSLRFSGSVVQQLEAVFADLWLINTGETLTETAVQAEDIYTVGTHEAQTVHESHDTHEENEKYEEHDVKPHKAHNDITPSSEDVPARIIYSDPISRSHTYDRYLTVLLMAAKKRIYVWMPYMIPTQTMRDTLIGKRKMGVDVKVLMPGKSDSMLVDNSHKLVLRELFHSGITCAESTGDFDHSKILIIDDLVVLGSTNLDFRSLYRNYEANIEVNDEHFSQTIVTEFEAEFDNARPVLDIKTPWLKTVFYQFTSLIAALY